MMMAEYGRVLPGIELVVFDLDGTLADTKSDLALSVNAMREYMGLTPLPLEAVTSYVGHGVTALVRHALGDKAADDEVEKLLEKGEGWLAGHPEKEEITRRYLKHRPSLFREALARLVQDEEPADEDDDFVGLQRGKGLRDWQK